MVLSEIDAFHTSKPPPCGKYAEQVDDEDEEEEVDDDYSDDAVEFDDDDDDDDEGGLGCPFCSEDFDVLGLCCHIDVAHHKEIKAAICPVCAAKVDVGMTVHLITKHESILKILRKRKICNGESRLALSSLKKELHTECLQISSTSSSPVKSSVVVESDSFFVPFCHHPPLYSKPKTAHPSSEASLTRNSSLECYSESQHIDIPSIPEKNADNSQKCDFVKELLFSLILDDNL